MIYLINIKRVTTFHKNSDFEYPLELIKAKILTSKSDLADPLMPLIKNLAKLVPNGSEILNDSEENANKTAILCDIPYDQSLFPNDESPELSLILESFSEFPTFIEKFPFSKINNKTLAYLQLKSYLTSLEERGYKHFVLPVYGDFDICHMALTSNFNDFNINLLQFTVVEIGNDNKSNVLYKGIGK